MKFIKATNKDLIFLFNLRNDSESVKYSKRGRLKIDEIKNDYFYNNRKKVFIVKHADESIGYLIFEFLHGNMAEISIAVSPEHRNKGLGKDIIKKGSEFAENEFGLETIIAHVFSENKASLKIFEDNSYKIIDKSAEPWKLIYGKNKKTR